MGGFTNVPKAAKGILSHIDIMDGWYIVFTVVLQPSDIIHQESLDYPRSSLNLSFMEF